jgi:hypothetical protein
MNNINLIGTHQFSLKGNDIVMHQGIPNEYRSIDVDIVIASPCATQSTLVYSLGEYYDQSSTQHFTNISSPTDLALPTTGLLA